MQRNILYDRMSALPGTRGYFHRPRLNKLLSGFSECHLITVTAGAGWGKTYAVSAFLKDVGARVVWFQLTELDNHLSRFWEEFVHMMTFQCQDTAALFEQLGFPETLAKFDRFLHILAREIYANEQMFFVFDDFHLISDEQIMRFVEKLVLARLENFCVIINTRTKSALNIAGMISSGLAGEITAGQLSFTLEETRQYLKRQGAVLTAREVKKVYAATEGWPFALYLASLSIKKSGGLNPIAGAIPVIFEMIDKELFSSYSEKQQRFFVMLSLLVSFTEGVIQALAGEDLADTMAIVNDHNFIYYNPYTGHYNFHRLFLEFLKGKQKYLSSEEITDTYLKAADWCAQNGLKLEAFSYYDKCGCHDKILDIMVNLGPATFSKKTADFCIELIDKFPDELIIKNPMVHVVRAGLLLNNARIQPAIEELLETQRRLEAGGEENKAVLGEVYNMLGLLSLGSSNLDFVELFKKASLCLSGSKMIDSRGKPLGTKYAIMLTTPAHGELKKMEEALFQAIPYASKTMRGYASGMDYLASAEAAYFTGDMKKAAKNAYEAIYRAKEKQVTDVASSGYFLLMRIEVANGNYDGVVSNLEQLRAYTEATEDIMNFNGMLDVAEGWFNLTVGGGENVALWIVDDIESGDVLAPYSFGMERLIKARYLLKNQKYYELLAWLSQAEALPRQYGMWLILLDILIYRAVAARHVQDMEQAALALLEAYEIAVGNNLIMQFIELGNDIRSVIYNVRRREGVPSEWLEEIYSKAATYEKHLRSLKSRHNKTGEQPSRTLPKCTKREKEMLSYLCQGLTNQEIANTCFITVSAVKKSLNNIYIKLGATNRADAVRIALQLELC